ncbi:hypothetical protein IWQ56_000153 [Coemansia nantahalensis]|nr:hypothetical protein IWQ56_000153 [Coemansia nantahalensis]
MASDPLHSTPPEAHAQAAVAVATLALHLRATTQIDELMRHASTAVQQRWDFLGPSAAGGAPTSALFAQIDSALEWQPGSGIGDHIRDAHFARELAEEQQETLHPAAIRYVVADAGTVYAYAPFAKTDAGGESATLAVVLLWEDGAWRYFDAQRQDKAAQLHTTIAAAEAAWGGSRDASGDSDDDDYWGQFPQPDAPAAADAPASPGGEEDYWGRHLAATPDGPDGKPEQIETPDLVARSVQHALAAAAAAAQAGGMSEAAFVAAAQRHYRSI